MITAQEAWELGKQLEEKQKAKRQMELEIVAFRNKDLMEDIQHHIKETVLVGRRSIVVPMGNTENSLDIDEVRDIMEYLNSLGFSTKLSENCGILEVKILW